jgi:prevent-host-death family protein
VATGMKEINIRAARAHFSKLVAGAEAGQQLIILKRGRPAAALISIGELRRLRKLAGMWAKLAAALGQSHELLEEIERGEAHPAMVAFGLWQHEDDLEGLTAEIRANRDGQHRRGGVTP